MMEEYKNKFKQINIEKLESLVDKFDFTPIRYKNYGIEKIEMTELINEVEDPNKSLWHVGFVKEISNQMLGKFEKDVLLNSIVETVIQALDVADQSDLYNNNE